VPVSIVVPHRAGACVHRDNAWAYVRARLEQMHGSWELVVADGGACTAWSKGAALHEAVSASSGDVMVLHDSDSYVDPVVLERCVQLVASGRCGWAMPHGVVKRYDERSSALVYAGTPPRRPTFARRPYRGVSGGGIVVVSRAAWDIVGGVDPRFEGWGGEDLAFGYALRTLIGRPIRLNAELVHLWHPPAAPDLRPGVESAALLERYRSALSWPEAMRVLVAEQAAVSAK
jgi:hypothetical protein